jgi:hypothetical protein
LSGLIDNVGESPETTVQDHPYVRDGRREKRLMSRMLSARTPDDNVVAGGIVDKPLDMVNILGMVDAPGIVVRDVTKRSWHAMRDRRRPMGLFRFEKVKIVSQIVDDLVYRPLPNQARVSLKGLPELLCSASSHALLSSPVCEPSKRQVVFPPFAPSFPKRPANAATGP